MNEMIIGAAFGLLTSWASAAISTFLSVYRARLTHKTAGDDARYAAVTAPTVKMMKVSDSTYDEIKRLIGPQFVNTYGDLDVHLAGICLVRMRSGGGGQEMGDITRAIRLNTGGLRDEIDKAVQCGLNKPSEPTR